MKEIPAQLDWIAVRAACSLTNEYLALRADAQANVDSRKKIETRHYEFALVQPNESLFIVSRTLKPDVSPFSQVRSVGFYLKEDHIQVHAGQQNNELFRAKITVNDSGECVYKVGEKELYRWQVLRKALEPLFFEFE